MRGEDRDVDGRLLTEQQTDLGGGADPNTGKSLRERTQVDFFGGEHTIINILQVSKVVSRQFY